MTSSVLDIGRVVEVDGTQVLGFLDATIDNLYRTYKSRKYKVGQIGSIVKISSGNNVVFGAILSLKMKEDSDSQNSFDIPEGDSDILDKKWVKIQLFGEGIITGISEDDIDFRRGVYNYPLPGQTISIVTSKELKAIFLNSQDDSLNVGHLTQEPSLPVNLDTDMLLSQHFAILGSTGTGKSCANACFIDSIINNYANAHIILLDPHGEYHGTFGHHARTIDTSTLQLPHWIMNLEECVATFIGRSESGAIRQTDILKDAIFRARSLWAEQNGNSPPQSVDSPVPFKIGDLLREISDSKPSQQSQQDPFKKVINKIESLNNDSRFSFLIRPDFEVSDNLEDIVSDILRIDNSGKSISILDLSGVPSEVMDVVVGLISRILFDFALWCPKPVRVPTLLICEEAHRYVPRSDTAALSEARKGLSRIAKEGRKYGIGLGLVSQRPAEIDPSVISQCSTVCSLRMTNDSDQTFVERALPDSVSDLAKTLPALRNQEGIIVGQATPAPMRVTFRDLPEENLPQSHGISFARNWGSSDIPGDYVRKAVCRWRGQEVP